MIIKPPETYDAHIHDDGKLSLHMRFSNHGRWMFADDVYKVMSHYERALEVAAREIIKMQWRRVDEKRLSQMMTSLVNQTTIVPEGFQDNPLTDNPGARACHED